MVAGYAIGGGHVLQVVRIIQPEKGQRGDSHPFSWSEGQ
jgi:1,4-dihydroxy-2-naphthoyl-CoA synthase